MPLSRPRRGREEDEEEENGDDGRAGGEGPQAQGTTTPAKRPRRCCSCCQDTKDFYEEQIEMLKKEMQCMSKGLSEERRILQREMQQFYQNSQLQLNEHINEQHWRMEQIWEQFNTLISVNIYFLIQPS